MRRIILLFFLCCFLSSGSGIALSVPGTRGQKAGALVALLCFVGERVVSYTISELEDDLDSLYHRYAAAERLYKKRMKEGDPEPFALVMLRDEIEEKEDSIAWYEDLQVGVRAGVMGSVLTVIGLGLRGVGAQADDKPQVQPDAPHVPSVPSVPNVPKGPPRSKEVVIALLEQAEVIEKKDKKDRTKLLKAIEALGNNKTGDENTEFLYKRLVSFADAMKKKVYPRVDNNFLKDLIFEKEVRLRFEKPEEELNIVYPCAVSSDKEIRSILAGVQMKYMFAEIDPQPYLEIIDQFMNHKNAAIIEDDKRRIVRESVVFLEARVEDKTIFELGFPNVFKKYDGNATNAVEASLQGKHQLFLLTLLSEVLKTPIFAWEKNNNDFVLKKRLIPQGQSIDAFDSSAAVHFLLPNKEGVGAAVLLLAKEQDKYLLDIIRSQSAAPVTPAAPVSPETSLLLKKDCDLPVEPKEVAEQKSVEISESVNEDEALRLIHDFGTIRPSLRGWIEWRERGEALLKSVGERNIKSELVKNLFQKYRSVNAYTRPEAFLYTVKKAEGSICSSLLAGRIWQKHLQDRCRGQCGHDYLMSIVLSGEVTEFDDLSEMSDFNLVKSALLNSAAVEADVILNELKVPCVIWKKDKNNLVVENKFFIDDAGFLLDSSKVIHILHGGNRYDLLLFSASESGKKLLTGEWSPQSFAKSDIKNKSFHLDLKLLLADSVISAEQQSTAIHDPQDQKDLVKPVEPKSKTKKRRSRRKKRKKLIHTSNSMKR